MKNLILLLFVLTSQLSIAQDCDEKDLSTNLGPVRDQKDVGWCFANTGADLLLSAYQDDLQSQQISSSYVAMNYFFTEIFKKEKKMDTIFSHGGNIAQSIQIIADSAQKKVCMQLVDEKMLARDNKFYPTLSSKLEFYRKLYAQYQEFYRETDPAKRQILGQKLLEKKDGIIALGDQAFLNLYVDQYDKIIEALQQPTLDESVMKLIDVVCADESMAITKFVKFQNYYRGGKNGEVWDSTKRRWANPDFDFLTEINKALDHNKIVGISYNVENVLTQGKPTGPHASSIVGRKLIDGQCHYKVRNSWGPDCFTGYTYGNVSQGQDENQVYNNPNSPPLYKFACEGGNFWLPEDKVKAWVFDITFVAEPEAIHQPLPPVENKPADGKRKKWFWEK
jgi:hypothetical protein